MVASSGNASGIRDYELLILSGMRGNDAVVKDALRRRDADQAEMTASRDRTEHVFLPVGHFENRVPLLGPTLASETIDPPSPVSPEAIDEADL